MYFFLSEINNTVHIFRNFAKGYHNNQQQSGSKPLSADNQYKGQELYPIFKWNAAIISPIVTLCERFILSLCVSI